MKSSFTIDIDGTTTLSSFREKLFDHWDDLVRVDFSLHGAGSEINNDEKFASILVAKTDSTITVKSHAEGFSTLKEGAVFKWAGINNLIPDDGHFGSMNVDLDNPLHAEVIQHALVDLVYKNELYGPITNCAEASVREYISAVILACAKIAGDVKLSAERKITGKKGYGPLDYAMLYKDFFLLITEAKKDNLNHGVIQNLGQLVASREESLYNLAEPNKKRDYMTMAGDIASVPSTGIASTGKEWVLIRYVMLPQPAVYTSSPMTLPLLDGKLEDIKKHLLTLMSKLLGAIDLQKKAVNQYGLAKEQKREAEKV